MTTIQELKDALKMVEELTIDLTKRTRNLSDHPTGLDRRMETLTRRLGECIMLSREMEALLDEAIKERESDWMPDLS